MRIRFRVSVIHFPIAEDHRVRNESPIIAISIPSNDASIAVHTSGDRGSKKPQGSASGRPRLLTILRFDPIKYGV